MKKIVIATLILLTLILTACSSASNGTQSGSATQALSAQTELGIGSLKLEGTDQAITKEQATALLPLWQTMKELQSSDTAAQEEINALVKQIKGTLTAQQLQVIANMKLTSQDAFTVMQGQNVSVSSTQTTTTSSSQSQNFGGGPGGGGPAGGPPAGGDPMAGMGGGPTGSTTTSSTQTTSGLQSQIAGNNQMTAGIIDALIKLLEKKAAS